MSNKLNTGKGPAERMLCEAAARHGHTREDTFAHTRADGSPSKARDEGLLGAGAFPRPTAPSRAVQGTSEDAAKYLRPSSPVQDSSLPFTD